MRRQVAKLQAELADLLGWLVSTSFRVSFPWVVCFLRLPLRGFGYLLLFSAKQWDFVSGFLSLVFEGIPWWCFKERFPG